MTIKPIKTERDYQKTLREIEKLWDDGIEPNRHEDLGFS
jgi:antitoxin component HigA of HigAB toxin-antitoxin module